MSDLATGKTHTFHKPSTQCGDGCDRLALEKKDILSLSISEYRYHSDRGISPKTELH
jgi:hypothetical protein